MKKFVLLSILVVVVLLAVGVMAQAQQPAKVSRIAYIDAAGTPDAPEQAFKVLEVGLRELGYMTGQNIVFETRYAEGRLDRMPALVNELLRQKPDVFVAFNNVVTRELQKATKEIPIVISSSIDPVAAGYVKSLAHPGGNLTGVSTKMHELSAKRVELLKEIIPKFSRLAILSDMIHPVQSCF